eukprot:TRINITY_DN27136_c0_g1_i1.p1 TRINITY_DN27136_c0_g1~~TRINITY_DN27136_c0_g1_i1.p1  ORF type:complete len:424 (+),score=105.06 TRINITY_DN27136_c0_g1_i1:77-1348(+)
MADVPSPSTPSTAEEFLLLGSLKPLEVLTAEEATAEATKAAENAWTELLEAVSCSAGSAGAGSAAISAACERWRRSEKREGRPTLWSKLMSKTSASSAQWEKVTVAVRAGVPPSMRCAVWTACSGAMAKKRDAAKSGTACHGVDSVYQSLVERGLSLRNEAAAVIEADVPRTGCDNLHLEPLRRVLLAFAARKPDIGYCQAMNFIVATLLLHCDEESSFWILCSLVEDILPAGYFTSKMTGIRADLGVLNALICLYLPELQKHFSAHEVNIAAFATNWFLCLFATTLPLNTSQRLVDCLLHEGSEVLFRIALSLLRLCESTLLAAATASDAYVVLRAPLGDPASDRCEELLDMMHASWLRSFTPEMLLQLRKDEAVERRRAAFHAARAAAEEREPGSQDVDRGEPATSAEEVSLEPAQSEDHA